MKIPFKALKITDDIYWVGAIDWGIRDFHGYSTNRGTTYNAYLIIDNKITLIDTVKAKFKHELLSRIHSVIEPQKIDYIISNHAEMDHSGCLPEMIDIIKPQRVLASTLGVKALNNHFPDNARISSIEAVKDGESITTGKQTIDFLETKMLHWPDSMFSYLPAKKLLFSQDAFGMHLASNQRFADQIAPHILYYEAAKYYANILLLYSDRIVKLIERVKSINLSIDIIAPDHGPVWRKDIAQVIKNYGKWAEQKPAAKVVISYDTMWQSTELMARSIADGISGQGLEVKLLPLAGFHRSDVATELLEAGALIVGSPTINNNMFPTVADLLSYVQGLKPRNLLGFAFGSYGWSGESVKQVEKYLVDMGVDITTPPVKAKYVPAAQVLTECFNKGEELAKRLKQKCNMMQ